MRVNLVIIKYRQLVLMKGLNKNDPFNILTYNLEE